MDPLRIGQVIYLPPANATLSYYGPQVAARRNVRCPVQIPNLRLRDLDDAPHGLSLLVEPAP